MPLTNPSPQPKIAPMQNRPAFSTVTTTMAMSPMEMSNRVWMAR